jgi:hypothetical protein
MKDARVLIVGDSIVEAWLSGTMGNCEILNGGLGAGAIPDGIALLRGLKQDAGNAKLMGLLSPWASMIRVAGNGHATMLRRGKKSYGELIDLAKKMSLDVSVLTILPVEDGMPLGTTFFDPILIDRRNTTGREVAQEKGVRLIAGNNAFRRSKWSGISPEMVFI